MIREPSHGQRKVCHNESEMTPPEARQLFYYSRLSNKNIANLLCSKRALNLGLVRWQMVSFLRNSSQSIPQFTV
jgi:hypothetical protein